MTLDLNIVASMPQDKGPCVIAGFIGNSFVPDQMTPMRRAVCVRPDRDCLDLCVDAMFPAPHGFDFPGANDVTDPTRADSPGHLDCHVFGTPDLQFVGSVTVFYVKAP